jgi:hypothetical protein
VVDTTPAGAGTKHRSNKTAAEPQRQCAVTRDERPATDLIRFVAGPEGDIVPDLVGKLPGRGVSITATTAMVEAAVKRNVFARSLKRALRVPPDLAARVDRLMWDRLRQALSFAQKAGLVVSGFAKVEAAIDAGQLVALVQAGDAAEDGVQRLARKFRAVQLAAGRDAPVARILSIADLSLAICRSNVVHAGLTAGGQSRIVMDEARRLLRYRSNDLSQDFSTGAALASTAGSDARMAGDMAGQEASTDKA